MSFSYNVSEKQLHHIVKRNRLPQGYERRCLQDSATDNALHDTRAENGKVAELLNKTQLVDDITASTSAYISPSMTLYPSSSSFLANSRVVLWGPEYEKMTGGLKMRVDIYV